MRTFGNLLVISPEHYSFVKDQTESLSSYFQSVTNLVRYNPIAEISNILPINSIKNYRKKMLINLDNIPSNVSVFPTPIFYAPFEFQYRNLGFTHYRAVERMIHKKNINFDIIQAHATWSSGFVGAKLKEKYNVPFVITAHGFDIYDLPFKNQFWTENIRFILNSADHIITVSKSNLAHVERLNISTSVSVIPNGFKNDLFYPRDSSRCRKKLDLPQEKKIILTVGNLESVKGHTYLIEAMKKIVSERNDVLFLIVGFGTLYPKFKKQIRSLGLDNHIFLLGRKTHQEIPLWMNACDICVLPSLHEGNPTVMFEALGCGKPFVGTRVGGIPEVISSDDFGLLVEPADSGDLMEKILLALDRKWDREKIHANAQQYTWENIAKEIANVYTQVLK